MFEECPAILSHTSLEPEWPGLCVENQMAQSQVHDMYYWLGYNEREGNNSQ